MRIIADLHIHSQYSRSTSPNMNIDTLDVWAKKKGINLIGTGDFTHPKYFADLKHKLKPLGNGLFVLNSETATPLRPPFGKGGIRGGLVHFMLTAEVSSIYKQDGKTRKIHNLIFAPSFEAVEKINNEFGKRGNVVSDGRPIFGFSAQELIKIVLDVSSDCMVIPAHAWTPWFSIFGSKSGFDSIEECFGKYAKHIHAIETGLSSDPEMNWRLSMLDNITLISNSDAHSPAKVGREANVFDCNIDYFEIMDIIKKKDKKRFLYTVEFFPEEGKYHYDGHRECKVLMSPAETKKEHGKCHVCGKGVTVGVMHRVDELADRPAGFAPENGIPAKHLVPLEEIIAEAFDCGVNTAKVRREYERVINEAGSEFAVLLDLSDDEIKKVCHAKVAEGIIKVKQGKLNITPGYDGEFGKINIFAEKQEVKPIGPRQIGLF